jgi:hypothetical protein
VGISILLCRAKTNCCYHFAAAVLNGRISCIPVLMLVLLLLVLLLLLWPAGCCC